MCRYSDDGTIYQDMSDTIQTKSGPDLESVLMHSSIWCQKDEEDFEQSSTIITTLCEPSPTMRIPRSRRPWSLPYWAQKRYNGIRAVEVADVVPGTYRFWLEVEPPTRWCRLGAPVPVWAWAFRGSRLHLVIPSSLPLACRRATLTEFDYII